MKKALICGVSGQDGAYLARFLLNNKYNVVGTSRNSESNSFSRLDKLGIKSDIEYESMNLNDFRSVLQVIDSNKPNEIYNLAGQSSVARSFKFPMETMESINLATLNLLEAIKFLDNDIRFYNAGSSECFGESNGEPVKEDHPFRPRSPYAVAKASAYWATCNYREAYGIYASNGILFNHESPLRSDTFVTKKIVSSAVKIFLGSNNKLILGNLMIERDWGWAPEYVEAMWRILQHSVPDDFIVATGKTYPLQEFTKQVFEELDLNWKDHVILDKQFLRPSDLKSSMADPSKVKQELNWSAKLHMPEIVKKMVNYELELNKSN
tara:strand:+ start:885 stop:1853 length:969 start_codon:yes stop_codon:yes gene_type:complete